MLGMKKIFRIHNYSENMKAKISTYSFKGKVDMWCEDSKDVKGIAEDNLTWGEFEKLFKNQYLFEWYYDNKAREFYDLRIYGKCQTSNILPSF